MFEAIGHIMVRGGPLFRDIIQEIKEAELVYEKQKRRRLTF
jgi:hypothetical protein